MTSKTGSCDNDGDEEEALDREARGDSEESRVPRTSSSQPQGSGPGVPYGSEGIACAKVLRLERPCWKARARASLGSRVSEACRMEEVRMGVCREGGGCLRPALGARGTGTWRGFPGLQFWGSSDSLAPPSTTKRPGAVHSAR